MSLPIRLSISETAKFFGVNPMTIRRAIKNQEISYVVIRGRYRLHFESVLKWSQKRTFTKRRLNDQGIGQYVGQWKIKNKLYSPNPRILEVQH